MSKQPYQATDYIDVAARIAMFRDQYPTGSLQPADPLTPYRVETIAGDTYVVVVAAAFRSPDDPRPGIGMAYETYPGRTNFTRGSELQNAETSAWGRAIVAALAADTKKGIASSEEVRNRSAEREDPRATAVASVWAQAKRLGMDGPAIRDRYAKENGGEGIDQADARHLDAFADLLSGEGANGLPLNKDGSVSKRQTTEEQRVAAGMMADAETKAHKQLAAETVSSAKAERGVPDADPWADVTVVKPGEGSAA